MAQVKMDAPAEEQQTTAAPVTDRTVATRPDMAPSTYVQEDGAEGEFDRNDQDKVYLSIVAKVGELSNLFTPGDFLLNKEYVIGGTKQPIEVIALGIKKRYQNDLDFDPTGEKAETVDTAVEVNARGGEVGYRPRGDKTSTHYWKPILQILFLVKKPANISPDAAMMFPYEIAGNDYAVVGYTARAKTAYNGIAKPLIQARNGKGGVRGMVYQLSVKGETYEGTSWMQPKLRSTGQSSAEVLDYVRENALG